MRKVSTSHKLNDTPDRLREENRADSLVKKLKFEVSQEMGLPQRKEKNQN